MGNSHHRRKARRDIKFGRLEKLADTKPIELKKIDVCPFIFDDSCKNKTYEWRCIGDFTNMPCYQTKIAMEYF